MLNEAGFGTLRIADRPRGLRPRCSEFSCCWPIWAPPTPTSPTSGATIGLRRGPAQRTGLGQPTTPGSRGSSGGQFVGGGWTEANNVTLANLVTTVQADGDHFVVTGAKFYATGSLYADWLDVLGRADDGELLTALVRADDPGVTLVDDWDGFGQRHHRQRHGSP